MAGRGSGYHGCDYNDILHVLIPPATHHIMCTMPLYTHGDAYTTVCVDGWTDGWTDGSMHGWMDRWMDGWWMDEWMDG